MPSPVDLLGEDAPAQSRTADAEGYSPLPPESVRWFWYRIPYASKYSRHHLDIPHRGDLVRFNDGDSAALEAAYRKDAEALERSWWAAEAEVSTGHDGLGVGGGDGGAGAGGWGISTAAGPGAERPPALPSPSDGSLAGEPSGASSSRLPTITRTLGRNPGALTAIDPEDWSWKAYVERNTEDAPLGVCVRGRAYDVDLRTRLMRPALWPGPAHRVLRGTWFAEKGPDERVPLRHGVAEQLEEGQRQRLWRADRGRLRRYPAAPWIAAPLEITLMGGVGGGGHVARDAEGGEGVDDAVDGGEGGGRRTRRGARAGASDAPRLPRTASSRRVDRAVGGGGGRRGVEGARDAAAAGGGEEDGPATAPAAAAGGARRARRATSLSAPPAARAGGAAAPQPTHATALFAGPENAWLALPATGVAAALRRAARGGGDVAGGAQLPLRRGYVRPPASRARARALESDELQERADEEDSRREVEHLILVVHGVGQSLDKSDITREAGAVRALVRALDCQGAAGRGWGRVEVVPVQWRKALRLGADEVSARLQPRGAAGLRSILRKTVVELLHYFTPLHKEQLFSSLVLALNSQHRAFVARNPGFRGRVSIVAHSLGSVMCWDVLCNQPDSCGPGPGLSLAIDAPPSPERAAGRLDPADAPSGGSPRGGEERLGTPRARPDAPPRPRDGAGALSGRTPAPTPYRAGGGGYGEDVFPDDPSAPLEGVAAAVAASRRGAVPAGVAVRMGKLNFAVDKLVLLGSPLGVFLALRGVDADRGTGLGSRASAELMRSSPTGVSSLDGLPRATRVYNLFHPHDPVGHRIEPLAYGHLAPPRPPYIPSTPAAAGGGIAFAALRASLTKARLALASAVTAALLPSSAAASAASPVPADAAGAADGEGDLAEEDRAGASGEVAAARAEEAAAAGGEPDGDERSEGGEILPGPAESEGEVEGEAAAGTGARPAGPEDEGGEVTLLEIDWSLTFGGGLVRVPKSVSRAVIEAEAREGAEAAARARGAAGAEASAPGEPARREGAEDAEAGAVGPDATPAIHAGERDGPEGANDGEAAAAPAAALEGSFSALRQAELDVEAGRREEEGAPAPGDRTAKGSPAAPEVPASAGEASEGSSPRLSPGSSGSSSPRSPDLVEGPDGSVTFFRPSRRSLGRDGDAGASVGAPGGGAAEAARRVPSREPRRPSPDQGSELLSRVARVADGQLDPTRRKVGVGRLDFAIQESALTNQYLSALSAHFVYWSSPEVALFVLRALRDRDVITGEPLRETRPEGEAAGQAEKSEEDGPPGRDAGERAPTPGSASPAPPASPASPASPGSASRAGGATPPGRSPASVSFSAGSGSTPRRTSLFPPSVPSPANLGSDERSPGRGAGTDQGQRGGGGHPGNDWHRVMRADLGEGGPDRGSDSGLRGAEEGARASSEAPWRGESRTPESPTPCGADGEVGAA